VSFLDSFKTLTGSVVEASGTLADGATAAKASWDKVTDVFAGTLAPANTAPAAGAENSQRAAVNIEDHLINEGPWYKAPVFVVLVGVLLLLVVKAVRGGR
jgi:hypothetical protein